MIRSASASATSDSSQDIEHVISFTPVATTASVSHDTTMTVPNSVTAGTIYVMQLNYSNCYCPG
jgi:hypothetical protein